MAERWRGETMAAAPGTAWRGLRRAGVAALAALGISMFASLAAGSEPLPWSYQAPAECPSAAEFETALRARVPPSAFARDARRFLVSIAREGSGFVGRLTFSDEIGERVVEERSCGAVVEALIVFTTIALDPRDSPIAEVRSPSPSKPLEGESRAPDAPRRIASPASRPRPRPRPRPPTTLGFAGGVGLATGPVPGPAPLFTLAGHLHRPFAHERGLALRLGAIASMGRTDISTGELDAYLIGGRVEVTPTLVWRSLAFAAGPSLTLGALMAGGRDVEAARRTTSFWSDLGAVLRVAPRAGAVRVEAWAAVAAALTPQSYLLQRPYGERIVYDTPSIAVMLGAEIALDLGLGF